MTVPRTTFADTGVEVSSVCLGTMMFGDRTNERDSVRIMHRALDEGIDFWDTAPMYTDTECEKIVGKALSGRREKVFLATKVHKGVTYEDITGSCDESLERLGTDHVDLLQVHWPKKNMDLDQITRAMDDLVQAGKIRHSGCSNFPAWVLAEARALAGANGRARMISHQPPYNLIERGIEQELLPLCEHRKIAVIPYRPMCMGVLSGKYRPGEALPEDSRGQGDDRVAKMLDQFGPGMEALFRMAEARGVPVATVSRAWVQGKPGITAPIVGVSRMEQLDQLLNDISFELSEDESSELEQAFDSQVKETGLGDFPKWRRRFDVVVK